MSADRKAAMEWATKAISIENCTPKLRNLAAAFLEVTAELEQERKAREEAERKLSAYAPHDYYAQQREESIRKIADQHMLIAATEHDRLREQRRAESAEQRAAELRQRLDRVEAILQGYADSYRQMDGRVPTGDVWIDFTQNIIPAIRVLAAVEGQTESAATQDNQAGSPKGDFKALSSESLPNTSGPAPAADRVEMVSVPRKPTEAMIQAGYNFALGTSWPDDWYVGGATPELYTARGVWEAMIASADVTDTASRNAVSGALPAPAADSALPGLELAERIYLDVDGAEGPSFLSAIRAEIAKRTK